MKLPAEVIIEITPSCNLKCDRCFNINSFAKDGRMKQGPSLEKLKAIMISLSNAGIKQLRITGGEPLMSKDLFKILEFAKSLGFNIWLNSNATLVNSENISLIESFVDNVLISFNGFDNASDYLWTKTNKSFELKMKGIEVLNKSLIPVLRFGTVLTPLGVPHLRKILNLINNFDFKFWEVYREIKLHNSNDQKTLDINMMLEELLSVSVLSKRVVNIANAIPFCAADPELLEMLSSGGIYDDGHSRIVIDPNGLARPSYFINENIGDPLDILSCWNHPFMKKMRNLEFVPSECHDCKYVGKCKGGSRYNGLLNEGHYRGRDSLMNIENIKKK